MKNQTRIIRTYSELSLLPTFEERYEYLKLDGVVGDETFGYERYLNQQFYRSDEWKRIRDFVILRDNGCDLGLEGFDIRGKVLIHHMNTITTKDILEHSRFLVNPDYLICVSHKTHQAIHYGDQELLPRKPTVRQKNDTCPWRKNSSD